MGVGSWWLQEEAQDFVQFGVRWLWANGLGSAEDYEEATGEAGDADGCSWPKG